MKSSAQVVVIGGGVVGASVLYHLTKAGWTDVVLLERKQLAAGSTWHAAGGMHTLNGDPNVAKLQQYTVELYKEIEAESGQDCGIHLPGGLMMAADPVRMEWLQMAQARGRYLGMELEIVTPADAEKMFPLMDSSHFIGGLYDPVEGHVDPTGVTNAYAICAAKRGAEIYRNNWVSDLVQRPDGTWNVVTEKGNIHAEHVVNAGGLWAREVGRMAGVEHPILAMEHMYLVTEDLPEVAAANESLGHELPMVMDFKGEIYFRQEQGGMLLGTYEQACVPWSPHDTPWDYREDELLPPDIERLTPELEVAFQHYPVMADAGIKNVINGPFTFTPDGNPLVGPVRGLSNYWTACGVMAGLSQGGGVGLALATWMTEGDSGLDIWGMDVARFGPHTNLPYTNKKVQENYKRRFRIQFPNEELPEGRPLRTTPIYDRLTDLNAVWGADYGLEHALWFQEEGKDPVEEVTFRRSNAWDMVREESLAVREKVGLTEISNFAKYRVSGPGSAVYLSGLFTNSLPSIGRTKLTAALNEDGRIIGEFSVSRLGEDEFYLFGSMGGEVYHSRWFEDHMPTDGSVRFEVLGLNLVGLSLAGPMARDVLQPLMHESLETSDFGFMRVMKANVSMIPCLVSRMTYTGDLGYEIFVLPEYQRQLFDLLREAGESFGMRMFGLRALITLRLEKNFGTWFREYRPIYTPLEAGMDRFIKLDHEFIGRAAVEAEMVVGPKRKLVMFRVDVDPDHPTDVLGDEPIWHGGEVVGWITSGGYAHYSEVSLAWGYIPAKLATEGTEGFEIEIIGQMRPAELQLEPVLDPQAKRMRV